MTIDNKTINQFTKNISEALPKVDERQGKMELRVVKCERAYPSHFWKKIGCLGLVLFAAIPPVGITFSTTHYPEQQPSLRAFNSNGVCRLEEKSVINFDLVSTALPSVVSRNTTDNFCELDELLTPKKFFKPNELQLPSARETSKNSSQVHGHQSFVNHEESAIYKIGTMTLSALQAAGRKLKNVVAADDNLANWTTVRLGLAAAIVLYARNQPETHWLNRQPW